MEGIPGLKVMEVNPEKMLKKELKSWEKIVADSNFDTFKDIAKLQQWLGSLPGTIVTVGLCTLLITPGVDPFRAAICSTLI